MKHHKISDKYLNKFVNVLLFMYLPFVTDIYMYIYFIEKQNYIYFKKSY